MDANNLELQKDSYVSFDAISLKDHLNKRLTKSGILTDQKYEGSNISQIRDIVAFTFQNLIYYLNRTSSDSVFSHSQLYENMNRIVKDLDYKPIGAQASTLAFSVSASALLTKDFYIIPRYSFIPLNSVSYSFNKDIVFAKTKNGIEELTELSKQNLLFQGRYVEFPTYIATGETNELVYLTADTDTIIDHFNIDVYVKINNKWQQFTRAASLYLETASARKYEIRYNENGNYEIKFGNDINGRRLLVGEEVSIYYLSPNGAQGDIGAGALTNHSLVKFTTTKFNVILGDTINDQYQILASNQINQLKFSNNSSSTTIGLPESVEDIRRNAPATFRSQYRLVTEKDYETFIKTNFANLVHDAKVANNTTYLAENLKYYYSMGITNPNLGSRANYSQINFSDTCNFNNIYVICVPRIVSGGSNNSYLTPSQKELIISSMIPQKTATTDLVLIDPSYIAISIGLNGDSPLSTNDTNFTRLVIVKNGSSRKDDTSLRKEVAAVIKKYFSRAEIKLGQTIDVNELSNNILGISGVKSLHTIRTDTGYKYEGLGLLAWNPIYPETDIQLIFRNLTFPYFKFPYLDDVNNIQNKIDIIGDNVYQGVDY